MEPGDVTQHALTVALAEYGHLRDELQLHLTAAGRLIALNFTALAAVFGVVFTQKVSDYALLAVPLAAAALGLAWLDHQAQVQIIGHYIRSKSWPYIRGLLDSAGGNLPSWEDAAAAYHANTSMQLVIVVYSVSSFVVPAIVALVVVFMSGISSSLWWLVWTIDVVLTTTLLSIAVAFAIRDLRGYFVPDQGKPAAPRKPPRWRGLLS